MFHPSKLVENALPRCETKFSEFIIIHWLTNWSREWWLRNPIVSFDSSAYTGVVTRNSSWIPQLSISLPNPIVTDDETWSHCESRQNRNRFPSNKNTPVRANYAVATVNRYWWTNRCIPRKTHRSIQRRVLMSFANHWERNSFHGRRPKEK
jgi:hypothetical protein